MPPRPGRGTTLIEKRRERGPESPARPRQSAPGRRRGTGLTIYGRPVPVFLIALEKAVSTLALAGGAVLAFISHGHPGTRPVEVLFSREIAADPENVVVHWLATRIPYLSPNQELAIGIGLVFWALLFAAQTVGVWSQALWGELLVIGETAAFLPVEAWNLVRHTRPLEFVTTPINLLILGYLIHSYRERKKRAARL
jgi:uncharacterized membrane protein (DUF2068 family)